MLSFIVEGTGACFTRPELKVERVSYDVMTPSAARGIAEAIYWKPCLQYRIQSIDVLKPIQHMQLRRNEVKSRAQMPSQKIVNKGGKHAPYGIACAKDRTQRAAIILRDVEYRVNLEFDLVKYGNNPGKHHAIFSRRVTKGQVFRRPYLGCREFSAEIYPDDPRREAISSSRPLGRMLFDLQFDEQKGNTYDVTPVFFQAELDNGTLNVPQTPYDTVYQ